MKYCKVYPIGDDMFRIAEESGFSGSLWFDDEEERDGIVEAAAALADLNPDDKGQMHAICFRDADEGAMPPTATMARIDDRIARMRAQRDKYEAEHSIHGLAAKLVTCTDCGSKIAKDRMEGEMCPVCGADLRAPYIPEQIEVYETKIGELMDERAAARARQMDRAAKAGEKVELKRFWLVPVKGQTWNDGR